MRKYLSFILFFFCSLTALRAQYTADGYYRVRNRGTQRYLYVTDNTGYYDMNRDMGDFEALQLRKGEEAPISDPSSIIFIKSAGSSQFDLCGQGTGIYALVQYYVNVFSVATGPFKGSYTVSATAKGVTKYLSDNERTQTETGTMGTGGSSPYRNWDVIPVQADGDGYFGITPTVQVKDKYYYPLYADFPFTLHSQGMNAYIISMVDGELAVLKPVDGVVPASTPVLIECSSSSASQNRLDLRVSSAKPLTDNALSGVYFSNPKRPKSQDALTEFNASTMRVLGLTSEGKLGFVSRSAALPVYSGKTYLPANQSYLSVTPDAPEELTIITEQEYEELLPSRTYTLTYMVDGVVYHTQTYHYEEAVKAIDAPEREGYTFNGWQSLPQTMPNRNVVVTASYTPKDYTLTFMLDGALFRTQTVPCGQALVAPDVPEREGYVFSGWIDLPKVMPAHDLTVYGTYEVPTFTLIYMVDDNVYQTVSLPEGAVVTPLDAPVREGYSFSGWDNVPETMPSHDVVIRGSFTVNRYILTFVINGAGYDQKVYHTASYDYGAKISVPSNPFNINGYDFSGWIDLPETMPAHDLTIQGIYQPRSFSITYMLGGKVYETVYVPCGSKIEPLEAPEREGYTFNGWSNLPETMPYYNITVSGSYSVNTYTITYILNGCGYENYVFHKETYRYDDVVKPLTTVPTVPGATFQGWTEIPARMPGHDVEVYGTFVLSGIDDVVADKGKDVLYDLTGKRVTGTPVPGIYIRNGKKVFIR